MVQMGVNVYHLYHLRMIMNVVSLASYHSHTLGPEKYVHHPMDHVQQRALMALDCLILITFCLYQHLPHVSLLCLVHN